MKKSVVLIVEDHPGQAQLNCELIERLLPEAYFVKAETPDQARERLKLETPDFIVVDLHFGEISGEKSSEPGLELLKEIFAKFPSLNILISSNDPDCLVRIKDEINNHEGGFVVSDKLEGARMFLNKAEMGLNGAKLLPKEILRGMPINNKEQKILKLLWHKCWKDKRIALEMGIGERTVQNHIRNMKDKLDICGRYGEDASERVALCREAVRLRLV